MLKRSLIGGVAAFGLLAGGAAFAADMPTYTPPAAPAPMAPVGFYDWTGVYAGIVGGYAWGDYNDALGGSVDGDGALIGGTLGANWQVDQFVFGIEGDLSWSDIDGGITEVIAGQTFSTSVEHEWLATIRGRLGVAVDSMLIYATGGLAIASIDASVATSGPLGSAAGSDSNTHTGWTLGAGIEAGLTENLSIKAEYLYVDLGSENYTFGGVDAGGLDWDGHVIRAGLNYRFNMF